MKTSRDRLQSGFLPTIALTAIFLGCQSIGYDPSRDEMPYPETLGDRAVIEMDGERMFLYLPEIVWAFDVQLFVEGAQSGTHEEHWTQLFQQVGTELEKSDVFSRWSWGHVQAEDIQQARSGKYAVEAVYKINSEYSIAGSFLAAFTFFLIPYTFSETVTVEATLYDPNGTAVQTYEIENEATHYFGSVAPLVGSAPEEDAPLAVATNQLIMAIWESGQLEAQAWR